MSIVPRLRKLLAELFQSPADERSVHQLATAVSLGIAVGLVPKVNLIGLGLLLLLFVLRVHLIVGLLTASVAALLGMMIDPHLHWLGDQLLETESLRHVFLAVYSMPFGPWTAINNTVVVGSLVVGLLQLLPSYLMARSFFAKQAGMSNQHWLWWSWRAGASPNWRI